IASMAGGPDHMSRHDLPFNSDREPTLENEDARSATHESWRRGVAIGLPRNAEVVADDTGDGDGGIKAAVREHNEVRPLGFKTQNRLLLGGAVNANPGLLRKPTRSLAVEVVETGEASPREEIALDVAERILDFPFTLLVAGSQGHGRKAVVLSEALEQRMKENAVFVALEHHLLHAVVEDLMRNASGRFEGEHVGVADGVSVCVKDEAYELPSAVAEDE
ncbi:MAG: hypothetical protein AAB250_07015, partial [Bdellovibrionota bacterium]